MAAFEEIEARITASTGDFEQGISNAVSSLDTLESKSSKVDKAIGGLGAGMAAAAAGGIAKSVSAFADLDASLTESQAIMGDLSQGEMKGMEDAAREVGRTTTFAADEAGEAFYFLASAGLDAEQSIAAMGDVANFAQAGAFDLATATDLATDAQSALGLSADDAAENQENLNRVMDVLVKSNQLANASVEEFSSALTNKAAASMKEAGMEIEEGASVLATFADQGLKGQRAGTILARTIEGLQSAARDNADAFENLGVSVYDANGNMRPMADITQDLEKGLAGMSTEQKNAAMEQLGLNERAQQGINLMLGNSDAMREYEGELQNAGGAAEEVAENQLKSLNAQWDLLKSQVTDILIEIGGALAPTLERLMSIISGVVERIGDVVRATDGWAGVIGLVVTGITGLTLSAAALASHLGMATSATSALAGGFGALLGPIGLVIGAVVALGAAYTSNFAGIRDATHDVIGLIQGQFVKIFTTTRNIVTTVLTDLVGMWRKHTSGVESSVARIVGVVRGNLLAGIQSAANRIHSRILQLGLLWKQHRDTVDAAIGQIVQIAGAAFAQLVNVVRKYLTLLQTLITAALGPIRSVWAEHGDALISETAETFGVILSTVRDVLGKLWSGVIQPVLSQIEAFWQTHGDRIIDVAERMWWTVGTIISAGLDIILTAIRSVLALIRGDTEAFSALWSKLWQRMLSRITKLLHQWPILSRVRDITSQMTQAWEDHVGGVRESVGLLMMILRRLLGPIGIVAGAIWKMADEWNLSFESIKEAVRSAWERIRGIFTTESGAIQANTASFLGTLSTLWTDTLWPLVQTVLEVFDTVEQIISDVLTRLLTAVIIPTLARITELWEVHFADMVAEAILTFEVILKQIRPLIDALRILIQTTLTIIKEIWQRWGDEILTIVEFVFDTIGTVIEIALDALLTIIRVGMAVVRQDWEGAWELIAGFLERTLGRIIEFARGWGTRFLEWVGGLVEGVINWFKDLAQRLVGGSIIPEMFNQIIQTAQGFGERLLGWLGGLVQQFIMGVQRWVQTFIQRVVTGWMRIIATAQSFGSNLLNWLGGLVSMFISTVGQWMQTFIQRVVTGWMRIISTAQSFGSNLLNWLSGLVSTFLSTVGGWIEAFIQRMIRGWSRILSTAASFGSSIISSIMGIMSTLWDIFRGALRTIIDGFFQTLSNIYEWVSGTWAGDLLGTFIDLTTDIWDDWRTFLIDVAGELESTLSGMKSTAESWVSDFVQPFEDAKDRVIDEFEGLKSRLVGSSIVPDMLNQSLSQTRSWRGDFTGEYSGAAREVEGSFSRMGNAATSPTPGAGTGRIDQGTMRAVADALEEAYGHVDREALLGPDADPEEQRTALRMARETEYFDPPGMGGRVGLGDIQGELSAQTGVMAEGFEMMAGSQGELAKSVQGIDPETVTHGEMQDLLKFAEQSGDPELQRMADQVELHNPDVELEARLARRAQQQAGMGMGMGSVSGAMASDFEPSDFEMDMGDAAGGGGAGVPQSVIDEIGHEIPETMREIRAGRVDPTAQAAGHTADPTTVAELIAEQHGDISPEDVIAESPEQSGMIQAEDGSWVDPSFYDDSGFAGGGTAVLHPNEEVVTAQNVSRVEELLDRLSQADDRDRDTGNLTVEVEMSDAFDFSGLDDDALVRIGDLKRAVREELDRDLHLESQVRPGAQ